MEEYPDVEVAARNHRFSIKFFEDQVAASKQRRRAATQRNEERDRAIRSEELYAKSMGIQPREDPLEAADREAAEADEDFKRRTLAVLARRTKEEARKLEEAKLKKEQQLQADPYVPVKGPNNGNYVEAGQAWNMPAPVGAPKSNKRPSDTNPDATRNHKKREQAEAEEKRAAASLKAAQDKLAQATEAQRIAAEVLAQQVAEQQKRNQATLKADQETLENDYVAERLDKSQSKTPYESDESDDERHDERITRHRAEFMERHRQLTGVDDDQYQLLDMIFRDPGDDQWYEAFGRHRLVPTERAMSKSYRAVDGSNRRRVRSKLRYTYRRNYTDFLDINEFDKRFDDDDTDSGKGGSKDMGHLAPAVNKTKTSHSTGTQGSGGTNQGKGPNVVVVRQHNGPVSQGVTTGDSDQEMDYGAQSYDSYLDRDVREKRMEDHLEKLDQRRELQSNVSESDLSAETPDWGNRDYTVLHTRCVPCQTHGPHTRCQLCSSMGVDDTMRNSDVEQELIERGIWSGNQADVLMYYWTDNDEEVILTKYRDPLTDKVHNLHLQGYYRDGNGKTITDHRILNEFTHEICGCLYSIRSRRSPDPRPQIEAMESWNRDPYVIDTRNRTYVNYRDGMRRLSRQQLSVHKERYNRAWLEHGSVVERADRIRQEAQKEVADNLLIVSKVKESESKLTLLKLEKLQHQAEQADLVHEMEQKSHDLATIKNRLRKHENDINKIREEREKHRKAHYQRVPGLEGRPATYCINREFTQEIERMAEINRRLRNVENAADIAHGKIKRKDAELQRLQQRHGLQVMQSTAPRTARVEEMEDMVTDSPAHASLRIPQKNNRLKGRDTSRSRSRERSLSDKEVTRRKDARNDHKSSSKSAYARSASEIIQEPHTRPRSPEVVDLLTTESDSAKGQKLRELERQHESISKAIEYLERFNMHHRSEAGRRLRRDIRRVNEERRGERELLMDNDREASSDEEDDSDEDLAYGTLVNNALDRIRREARRIVATRLAEAERMEMEGDGHVVRQVLSKTSDLIKRRKSNAWINKKPVNTVTPKKTLSAKIVDATQEPKVVVKQKATSGSKLNARAPTRTDGAGDPSDPHDDESSGGENDSDAEGRKRETHGKPTQGAV